MVSTTFRFFGIWCILVYDYLFVIRKWITGFDGAESFQFDIVCKFYPKPLT